MDNLVENVVNREKNEKEMNNGVDSKETVEKSDVGKSDLSSEVKNINDEIHKSVVDELKDEVKETLDESNLGELEKEVDDSSSVIDEKEGVKKDDSTVDDKAEEEIKFSDLEDDEFEFGEETKEQEKPSKDEYAVAKWLKANVPTKKTKFLNHHVEYFTGSKAVDALLASKYANGKNPLFLTRLECTDFLHTMLVHKLFHRAKKVPVSEQELKAKSKKKESEKSAKSGDEKEGEKSQASACEGKEKDPKDKEKEKDKKKRKIRLEMHLEQVFLDTADAYVWIYDPIPWHYWLCGALVVFGTIGVCLFPLWPATVRKGVYYLSIAAAAFLVLIVVLTILRVIIFCLVWALTLSRHHFWLLPNLTEDVGFFASFWPLYKYEYHGPGAETDKSKNKKKRKKDKQSDDEVEDKPPQESQDKASEASLQDKVTDDAKDNPTPPPEAQTESESENSQRSSTDRDFEMVDPADVDSADVDSGDTEPDPTNADADPAHKKNK